MARQTRIETQPCPDFAHCPRRIDINQQGNQITASLKSQLQCPGPAEPNILRMCSLFQDAISELADLLNLSRLNPQLCCPAFDDLEHINNVLLSLFCGDISLYSLADQKTVNHYQGTYFKKDHSPLPIDIFQRILPKFANKALNQNYTIHPSCQIKIPDSYSQEQVLRVGLRYSCDQSRIYYGISVGLNNASSPYYQNLSKSNPLLQAIYHMKENSKYLFPQDKNLFVYHYRFFNPNSINTVNDVRRYSYFNRLLNRFFESKLAGTVT